MLQWQNVGLTFFAMAVGKEGNYFFPSHCVCPTGSVGSYVIEKFPYGIVCAIPNFYMLIFSLEQQSSFLIYHTYLHDIYRERDRVFKNL